MSALSDLELARARWPQLSDAQRVRRLAQHTLDELALKPPIDPQIVASFRGIARIEEVPLPWAGCLTHEDDEVIARIRASDSRRRRRFTAFHEIKHTYLPGFTVTQFRCDPATAEHRRDQSSTMLVESLADIGASEFLLPRRHFVADIADSNDLTLDLVERLADRYDASLEATALRVVALADRDVLLICLEPGLKPSRLEAEPVLRVRWSMPRGNWPFVPRYKSVPDNSPFDRALAGEIVDEITTVRGLTSPVLSKVRVSSRLFPYTDTNGTTHHRVLALVSRSRRTNSAN
jgi:hypothetical protein